MWHRSLQQLSENATLSSVVEYDSTETADLSIVVPDNETSNDSQATSAVCFAFPPDASNSPCPAIIFCMFWVVSIQKHCFLTPPFAHCDMRQ